MVGRECDPYYNRLITRSVLRGALGVFTRWYILIPDTPCKTPDAAVTGFWQPNAQFQGQIIPDTVSALVRCCESST
jgi:hypothetical protein